MYLCLMCVSVYDSKWLFLINKHDWYKGSVVVLSSTFPIRISPYLHFIVSLTRASIYVLLKKGIEQMNFNLQALFSLFALSLSVTCSEEIKIDCYH